MRPDPEILAQVLRASGLSYRTTPSAYVFTCPQCGKPDKLHIRRAGKYAGYFVCFSGPCTADEFRGPNTEYALGPLLGIPAGEARELLGGAAKPSAGPTIHIPWLQDAPVEDEIPEVQHPDHHLDLRDPRATPGLAYLVSRGISLELAEEYGLRYSPVSRRVIAPICVDGRLLGWQGRSVVPTEWVNRDGEGRSRPKYVTEWGNRTAKGAPQVWIFQDRLLGAEHALVTEGYFDALAGHLVGGNVASGGKGAISPEKLRVLLGYGVKRIYSGLDPDAAERLGKLVRDAGTHGVEVWRLDVQRGNDLGAMAPEQVLELKESAKLATRHQVYVYLRSPTAGMARF